MMFARHAMQKDRFWQAIFWFWLPPLAAAAAIAMVGSIRAGLTFDVSGALLFVGLLPGGLVLGFLPIRALHRVSTRLEHRLWFFSALAGMASFGSFFLLIRMMPGLYLIWPVALIAVPFVVS